MTERISSSGAAAVDDQVKWLKIDSNTPRGVKLQLIHRDDGVAHYGIYKDGAAWTHFQRLPVFDDAE